jgi:predicted patatin/cPLA2 family phospholipase
MLNRHEVYKRQLDLCEKLEREGNAIIIRPLVPLTVESVGRDTQRILALHDEGHREGAEAVKRILERLS